MTFQIGQAINHEQFGEGMITGVIDSERLKATFQNEEFEKIVSPKYLIVEKVPSAREIARQQNRQLNDDILVVLSDGQPHCLRDIGLYVGNTYITGLSARVRGLRKVLPENQILKLHHVGTPEESTWYVLENIS
jgi:hypothetical protein